MTNLTQFKVPPSRTISPGTGLSGGGDLTANRTLSVTYGTTSGTACQGNDSRLSTNLGFEAGTTLGPTITSSTGSDVVIPSASETASGIVTTGTQAFAGAKTFNSLITGSISGNAATATELATARAINGVPFNGTAAITITANTPQLLTAGTGLTGSTFNGGTARTWSVTYGNTSGTVCQGNDSRLATNLSEGTRTTTTVLVESSTGNNATLNIATTTLAGVMSSADKVKLNGIASNAQVNVATNLGITAGTTAGPIVTSTTGTNATLPTATASASGIVTTGNQTFAGTKTFSAAVVLSTAGTTTSHAVRGDRTITAGNGLTGGGTLRANRTLTLGTPTSITSTSSNSVTASSHTHAVDSTVTRFTVTTTGSNKTLVERESCVVTASGRTITLPSSPAAGVEVRIGVLNFTNTTIARNSRNIMGLAENMTIDKANVTVTLSFTNATYGWRIA